MANFKVYLVSQWDYFKDQSEIVFAYSTREAADAKAVELNAEIDALPRYTSNSGRAYVEELTVEN